MNATAPKILFVDDDPNLLAAFQRTFRKQFAFDTALGGPEALRLLASNGPYAVVLADMRMPGMDGVQLLERVRDVSPHSVRMMLTGNADQQTAVEAVNRGHVFRFLNKPCPPEMLTAALEHGLNHYALHQLERELLEGTLTGSVRAMSEVLGMVAPEALGRGQRLRDSMRLFASFLGVTPDWELQVAALLSPLGYASVPVSVLRKLSSLAELSREEQAIVRRVPKIGHDLLFGIPRLKEVANIVLYHQQCYDGSGFPSDGVSGAHLPLGARMLKILLDRLDLEADGVVKNRALETMRARSGVYDPELLEKCFLALETFLASSLAADRPVRMLSVGELVVGQIIVSDITTRGGLTLMAAGNRLTPMVVERLRNYADLSDVKEPILVQDPVEESPAVPPGAVPQLATDGES